MSTCGSGIRTITSGWAIRIVTCGAGTCTVTSGRRLGHGHLRLRLLDDDLRRRITLGLLAGLQLLLVLLAAGRLLAGLRLLLLVLLAAARPPAATGLRLLPGRLLTGLRLLAAGLLLLTRLGGRLAALVQGLHQILELGHDAHAAFVIAGVGQGARPVDDLLDVVLTVLRQIGLGHLLLDLVQLLCTFLGLLREGRPGRHQRQPGTGQQQTPQAC